MKINKKIFILVFLLFHIGSQIFSFDDLKLNLIIESGLKFGNTNEMVYKDEKCISRLVWTENIIPTAAIATEFGIADFFTKLRITLAIPVICGFMEDYDYLLADQNDASNYSWHDIYLDKDFILGGEVGYNFRFGDFFISPSAGFVYQNRKWTAQDGYLQYPLVGLWTGNEPKQKIKGSVISYEQAIWYPYGAIELGYTFHYGPHSKLVFGINGSIYPLVSAQTNDTHFLRNVYFYDKLNNGFGWNSGIRIGYFPQNTMGIGLFFNSGLEKIIHLKGNTSSNNIGVYTTPLIIDTGYNSKMESTRYYFSISIFIPIFNE